jgi:hypothetical protein
MRVRSSSVRALATSLSYPLVRRPSTRSKLRATALWLALIAITQQISCSGGGGAGSTTTNDSATPTVSVTISPGSAQIQAGATLQFLVSVQNASNPAVNWQVNGIFGGNSSVGTITPSGTATASYMAPAEVSGVLTVTVAAALQADATKTGTAQLTVNPLPKAQATVSPSNINVETGASQQFSATVQNAPPAVIWEVNGIQAGNSTIGLINSSGFYTAPALIPAVPAVTITAILSSDLSVSGSATITIVAPLVSITISPDTANVPSYQSLQFSAAVQNSSASIIWQVDSVTGGDSTNGTITPSGLYTAPASVPSPPTVTVTAFLQTNSSIFASAVVTVVPPNTFTGVYSWRNDSSLTGQNPRETMLTPASVSSTTSPIFGKLFGCLVDGQIYAQPLYVANVTIAGVTHNLVYVATEHDSVYAFDADANPCQTLWQASFTNPAVGVTTVPATDIPEQTDIVPEIGITGTPVIDPTTGTLYVVTKTRVNQGATPSYNQELHALDLLTGAERIDSPAIIKATVNGIAFDPLFENQRSALLLASGNVFIAFDSYGDTEPFHGWLFAYNAADLRSAPAVFNTTPNGSGGGMGGSGAAPSSDTSGDIFVVSSDGTFDVNTGGDDYAETLLRLQLNSTPQVRDFFTPWNQAILNLPQKHFGSTGVLLLPSSAPSPVPLAIAGNEMGNLYVLNRNRLGGFNGANGFDNIVQTLTLTGPIFGTPAYWAANDTVYVAAAGDTLRALPISNGTLSVPSCTPPSLCSADTFPVFGASPVISWDGSNAASGIVWAVDTSGSATSAPALLRAYDATNPANELYASPMSGSGAAGLALKFVVPTVANGKVYLGTQNELSVFGLK